MCSSIKIPYCILKKKHIIHFTSLAQVVRRCPGTGCLLIVVRQVQHDVNPFFLLISHLPFENKTLKSH